LDELRKGRSFVLENDHTVILGWSPQIFAILSELVIANSSRSKSCITILAEKDKVEMEDEIRNRVGDTGRTRIVCRTGSPIDMSDLEIVNANGSRSIIVLSQESDDPDSQVIKTLLALINNPRRRPEPYHIVAEIHDPQNREVAEMVGRDQVKLMLVGSLISRIAVQTCRQSGLSVLYTELLDFGGDEIYFKEEPSLVGKTIGDALFAFDKSSVMGIRLRDGKVMLNPPSSTIIASGDALIVIAEDDSLIQVNAGGRVGIDTAAIQTVRRTEEGPERTLILGWNDRGVTVINELDHYVAPGSEVMVVADVPAAQDAIEHETGDVRNLTVGFRYGSTTDRRLLDALNIEDYDHIITLSYSDMLGPQEADARTLITLLHLRDIQEKLGKHVPVVSEMLDMRNRELADITRADDFIVSDKLIIVSDKLISLMLSQVSENRDLMAVFEDMFDPEGAEFYLKPAEDYVLLGQPVTMNTILQAALGYGEIAVGYRVAAEASDVNKHYGLHINPHKQERVTFAPGDRVIVLSSDSD
jgi:ion channel POLLUX/CASTOR